MINVNTSYTPLSLVWFWKGESIRNLIKKNSLDEPVHYTTTSLHIVALSRGNFLRALLHKYVNMVLFFTKNGIRSQKLKTILICKSNI